MDEIMDQVDPIMLERYAATARIYDGESDVMRIVALDGEPLAECRAEGWLPLGSPVSDDGITPDDGRARDYGLLERTCAPGTSCGCAACANGRSASRTVWPTCSRIRRIR